MEREGKRTLTRRSESTKLGRRDPKYLMLIRRRTKMKKQNILFSEYLV
jgi:hypothetical protein